MVALQGMYVFAIPDDLQNSLAVRSPVYEVPETNDLVSFREPKSCKELLECGFTAMYVAYCPDGLAIIQCILK